MGDLKHSLKKILEKFSYFLKYKQHLYVKPMFILIVSIIFISLFAFIMNRNEPDDTYKPISINFDKPIYQLDGIKIVLDPGHGGNDPGAPSTFGKNEARIVYTIAEKLEKVLTDSGAEVEMTRGENETVELDDRKVEGDIFVSIHSDAYVNNDASGFTTYYKYEKEEGLAEEINKAMDQYALIANRGVEEMSYQVIWQLDYPATLVELGYLSNEVDDSLLNNAEYQERMVRGIAEGINNYVNKKK